MRKIKWAVLFYIISLGCFVIMTWRYGLRAALLTYVASVFMGGSTAMFKEIEMERDETNENQLHDQ